MIKKRLKQFGLLLLVAFIVAQFFGPDKNDGDIETVNAFMADTNAPENVKVILKNACLDCHSSHTRYPWYNNITPVNYWLAKHVRNGNKHFNVSKWNKYSNKKKDHKLEELIEEVEEKHMPLQSYTWTHMDANLSEKQINALINWAKQARIKYAFEKVPQ